MSKAVLIPANAYKPRGCVCIVGGSTGGRGAGGGGGGMGFRFGVGGGLAGSHGAVGQSGAGYADTEIGQCPPENCSTDIELTAGKCYEVISGADGGGGGGGSGGARQRYNCGSNRSCLRCGWCCHACCSRSHIRGRGRGRDGTLGDAGTTSYLKENDNIIISAAAAEGNGNGTEELQGIPTGDFTTCMCNGDWRHCWYYAAGGRAAGPLPCPGADWWTYASRIGTTYTTGSWNLTHVQGRRLTSNNPGRQSACLTQCGGGRGGFARWRCNCGQGCGQNGFTGASAPVAGNGEQAQSRMKYSYWVPGE